MIGALSNRQGLLTIDKPEYSLHPVVQVALGDWFIYLARTESAVRNESRTLVVETHSEHLILRILRRITEAFEGKLPEGFEGIDPEDLSVTYFLKKSGITGIRRLRVTQQGGFFDNWPEGFFEERYEELF